MAVVDLNTFTLLEVNPVFTHVLRDDDLVGKTLPELMHPEDACRIKGQQTGRVLSGTYRFLTTTAGEVIWLSLSATAALEGNNTAYVIAHNITEDKQKEQELFRRAHYDLVTGLPNRHLFEDRVRNGLAQAEREGRRAALLFADLDKFKAVNDTHGHATGDIVLRVVASRLLNGVRQTDTVSRYAGDEFVIFLSMLRGPEEIENVVTRLRNSVAQPIAIDQTEVNVGASFGSAVFPDDASDIEALLTKADERMYRQKTNR